MNRRLLLAFILSFLFLSLWGRFFAPPPAAVLSNNAKHIENKRVMEKEQAVQKTNEPVSESREIKETTETIGNDLITLAFSNLGGSLKNVFLKKYTENLPLDKIIGLEGYEKETFKIVNKSQEKILYRLETKGVVIDKEYSILPDEYVVHSRISVTNAERNDSATELKINNFYIDAGRLDKNNQDQQREQGLYEYSVFSDGNVYRKTGAIKFNQKEEKTYANKPSWAGFRNRYFCAVVKPLEPVKKVEILPLSSDVLKISSSFDKPPLPSEIQTYKFISYFGPQNLELLKSYGQDFEKIMVFFRSGFLDGIAKAIYYIMIYMQKIIHNWGVCIILIALLFYGAMYPLTIKSMVSMKRMQSLQPKINKLREQHKNNPQKLNKEMMEMYKEHKINPLGGCLPMLLQMPIFIGLYQVLWRSVAFKGAAFLWIKDLSLPDRLMKFPVTVPALGEYLNILPIVMAIFMFLQQKVASKSMVTSDPAQAAQQKMMTMFFPFFIGFIFYHFASGLSLYFTVFYIMSTLTQIKMSKMTKAA